MILPSTQAEGRAPENFALPLSQGTGGPATVALPSDAGHEGRPPVFKLGRYELIEEIGRGGMGVVWRAHDPELQRDLALKVLPREVLSSSEARWRFRREAEIAGRIDHPGICPIIDTGEDGGLPWIAMRFVRGTTLASRIARRDFGGPKQIAEVLRCMETLARAVHAAHEAGIVHRDLKPGNVMIDDRGEPVVLDFGLARDVESEAPGPTRTGDVLGTPAYMAPEQIRGAGHRADRRTDVWALGVILYEALTFERPFDGASREQLYRAILTEEPASVRAKARDAARDVDVVVRTALAKDLHRRYASALALAEDLAALRERVPIRARPPGPWRRSAGYARRHPAAAATFAMLLVGGPLVAALITSAGLERARIRDAVVRTVNSIEAALAERDPARADRNRAELALLEREHPLDLAFAQRIQELRIIEGLETLALDDEVDPDGARMRRELEALRAQGSKDERLPILAAAVALRLNDRAAAQRSADELGRADHGLSEYLHALVDRPRGVIAPWPDPPKVPSARFAYADGVWRSALGDPRSAFASLAREIEREPASKGLAWLAAEQLTRVQDYEGALGYAGRARDQVQAFGARRLARYAVHLRRAGLTEEALLRASEALAMSPQDPIVRLQHANAKADARDFAGARHELEALLAVEPSLAHGWRSLATVLHDSGEHQQALAAYDRALEIAPTEHATRLGRANALLELKRPAEAAEMLRALVAEAPDVPYIWNSLLTAERDLGDFDAALKCAERALTLKPDYAAAIAGRGSILHRKGLLEDAERDYRRAIAMDSGLTAALFNLALIIQDDDREEACRLYRAILAVEPDDHFALINLAHHLSAEVRGSAEAIALLERACAAMPTDLTAWELRGAVLHEAGRTDEAISATRRALEIQPDHLPAHVNLMLMFGSTDPLLAYAHYAVLLNLDTRYAEGAEGNERALHDAILERKDDHPLARLIRTGAGRRVRPSIEDLGAARESLRPEILGLADGPAGSREHTLRRAGLFLLER